MQIPWVQAFREKQEEGHDPTQASGKPETPSDRDLSPRKMSDSYHSVVRSILVVPDLSQLTD